MDSACGEYYDAPLDKENEVTHYHVEFLGTPHSHAWVVAGLVHPFVSVPVVDKCPQFKNIQGRKLAEMKRSFYKALEEASRLVKMTLPERLATCRFKREGNEKNGGRSLFSSSVFLCVFFCVFFCLWHSCGFYIPLVIVHYLICSLEFSCLSRQQGILKYCAY